MNEQEALRPGIRGWWQLARSTRWAGERTLVGGDPFRAVRLTERGAAFVQEATMGRRAPRSPSEYALLTRLARGNLLVRPTARATPVEVTLVIPARATDAEVQRVIDSAPGIPVIVVDDGSAMPLDGRLCHDVALRVIRHDTPRGPAAARNAGARAATTPWVLFADADVIARPGWVGALAAYGDGVVAIAPRIITAPGSGAAAAFERAVCALDMGPDPAFVSPTGTVSYVPSAALLVRREAFLAAGSFDESMRIGEDVNLVWRLAEQGVYYEPSIVVGHRARASLPAALRRRAEYGASAGALAAKHPAYMRHGSFPAQTAIPWFLWLIGLPQAACVAALAGLALAPRGLRSLPAAAAIGVKARAQLRSAEALSRMLSRPLLPATLAFSLLHKGFRRRAGLAVVLVAIARRRSLAGGAWQLIDDAAYSSGVWRAAGARRSPSLLLPHVRWGNR